MISWIKGEVIDVWQVNQNFFVLINCQGLGYEIQILESFFLELKTNHIPNKKIILWIKHIKKEDSDSFFGFTEKDQKNFFIEILSVRGVGSQIAMGMLNKFSISEVINAINTQNKGLISSVPGIGKKMTERLILELKSKFKNKLQIENEQDENKFLKKKTEINKIFSDLNLTLQSLTYTKREIDRILSVLIKDMDISTKEEKNISFEYFLKLAINYLDNDSSNIVR